MTSVSGDPDNLQPFKSWMLSGPVEQSDRMLRNSRMTSFESNGLDLKPVIRVCRE